MKLMSESLDTIGAIARSVADAALLISACGGGDLGDPDHHTHATPRIGVCPGPKGAVADAATRALLETTATALARVGAHVSPAPLSGPFDALESWHPIMMNGESALSMAWELAYHAEQISDGLRERLAWGAAQGIAALRAAQLGIDALRAAFDDLMADFDIILTPSAPGEAPAGLEWTGDPCFNAAWTALHVPCVTIPAGNGPTGLPLGVQIVGRRGQDRQTLAWAAWVAGQIGG
jgi:amidase